LKLERINNLWVRFALRSPAVAFSTHVSKSGARRGIPLDAAAGWRTEMSGI